MRKRKALWAMLILVAMTVGMVSTGGAAAEEPTKLVFYMAAAADANLDDAGLVAEKINEYIEPLINATVELNFVNMGSYNDQLGLMIRGGQQIDVMFSFEAPTKIYISQEAITPLDDLLNQYGQEAVAQIGQEYIDACKVDGVVYSLPSMKDMATGRTFIYDKAMAEELGLDMDSVQTISDLTAIFAQVKEHYPDMVPYGGAGGNSVIFNSWSWDLLSDSLGVLMNFGDNLDVVHLFAQDEYSELLNMTREWYQNGYISSDFATSSETWSSRMKAGISFGGVTTYKPGCEIEASRNVGFEVGSVQILDTYSITGNVNNCNWFIPVTSANPEKAMEFMNLMYSDPVVANLLHNGIEGVHYEEKDGFISRINPDNHKYQQNLSWALGNQFITKVWEGNDADIWEQTREFNESAMKSQAFGFSYNNENIANELTACTNVVDKYRISLESGSVDPETVLPEFLRELEAAGIDIIIAEKQMQLDAWNSNK